MAAIDTVVFPQPRAIRTGSSPTNPTAAGLGILPPRSRSFWFELRTNANSRTTISTPQLKGPVIIQGLQWGAGGGSPPDAAGWFIDIGWAAAEIAEVNVAVSTARVWQSLFEDMVPRTANVPVGLTGFPSHSGWGAVSDNWWPINALVPGGDLHLILSILNLTAGVRVSHGTMYLTEAVSPTATQNFQ